MFATCTVGVSRAVVGGNCRATMRRSFSTAVKRSYMSTQPVAAPEEEPRMMLILGKPGGGKGTISKKILQVR